MAGESEVAGIALGLSLDTSAWSTGIARAKAELDGLRRASAIEIGVGTRRGSAGAIVAGGGGGVVAGGGGAAGTTMTVSPRFQVSAQSVRQLKTAINAELKGLSTQGEAVAVPVKLGRVPFASIRGEIEQGIGSVAVKIHPDAGSLNAMAAVLSQMTGQTVGKSRSTIESAAAARGIPRRAMGGSTSPNQPYLVGEDGPEIFRPRTHGTILPSRSMREQMLERRNEEIRHQLQQERGTYPARKAGGNTAVSRLTPKQRDYYGNVSTSASRLQPHHISGGKAWYTMAGDYGRAKAREYGVSNETSIGVLAALSAGTSWESNKTKFEKIMKAHASGQPFPYGMGLDAHRKAASILGGMDPKQAFKTSPKVGQFYPGMMGDLSTLTIDLWATRTATRGALEQPGRGRARKEIEDAYKRVAREHGMENAQLQASLWLLEKEESGRAPGQMTMFAKGGRVGGGYCSTCNTRTLPNHYSTAKHIKNVRGPSRGTGDWLKSGGSNWRNVFNTDAEDQYFEELERDGRARGGAAMRGAGFVPGLRSIAQSYNRKIGLPRMQEQILHPLDVDFSRRTAKAYERMPVGPDALSRRAYRAFGEETDAQYEFLQRAGFQFDADSGDPYHPTDTKTKMQLAADDVRKNKRLLAFGSALDHPLLTNEQNLKFRHVHDMMGHLTEGFSIGPRGEYNAAVKHSQMFTPLARMAMLAETHGQNSVVNFSDLVVPGHGGKSIAEVNKAAPGTIYAQQKAQVLPEDILEEFFQKTGIKRAVGGDVEHVSIETLLKHRMEDREKNPKIRNDFGYLDQLTEAMRAGVDLGPVTLDHDPRAPLNTKLFDGNHRLAAAMRLGIESLPTKMRRGGKPSDYGFRAEGGQIERLMKMAPAEQGQNTLKARMNQYVEARPGGLTVYGGRVLDRTDMEASLSEQWYGHEPAVGPRSMIGGKLRPIDPLDLGAPNLAKFSRNAQGGWAHRYRGGEAFNKRFEGVDVDLGGFDRKRRLEVGKALYQMAGYFPRSAQNLQRIRAIDSRTMNVLDRGVDSDVPTTAGLVQAENDYSHGGLRPRLGRPSMYFDTGVTDQTIEGMGAVPKNWHEVALHEFGHAVDFKHDLVSRGDDIRALAGLSKYGERNSTENWAEAFTARFKDQWTPGVVDRMIVGLSNEEQASHQKRQTNLARDRKMGWGREKGGDVGKYIVNEIGRELFVPKSQEGVIPPEVAAEIPGMQGLAARMMLGAHGDRRGYDEELDDWRNKTVGRQRGGGIHEIGGPAGPREWDAPEDGWIIPNRLKNKIPRALGGPTGRDDDRQISIEEYQALLAGQAEEENAPPPPRRKKMRTNADASTVDPNMIHEFGSSPEPTGQVGRAYHATSGDPRTDAERREDAANKRAREIAISKVNAEEKKELKRAREQAERQDNTASAKKERQQSISGARLDALNPPGRDNFVSPLAAASTTVRPGEGAPLSNPRPGSRRSHERYAPPQEASAGRGEWDRRAEDAFARVKILEAKTPSFDTVAGRLKPFNPQATEASIATSVANARTGRSGIGALVGDVFGGRNRRLLLAEGKAADAQYKRLAPEGIEGLNKQLREFQSAGANATREHEELNKAVANGAIKAKDARGKQDLLASAIERAGAGEEDANKKITYANELRGRSDQAFAAASQGAAKNLLAVTGAGLIFNASMQALGVGMELAQKTLSPLADQISGFTATNQRVTKDLAGELPSSGTLTTLFGRTGLSAGLSAGSADFLQNTLGGSVLAKAGATKAQSQQDLFKAAYGGGAPTGAIGGYGGLFGSGILGSELGGGRGLLETIAQTTSVVRGGAASPTSETDRRGGGFLGSVGRVLGTDITRLEDVGRNFSTVPALDPAQAKAAAAALDETNSQLERAATLQSRQGIQTTDFRQRDTGSVDSADAQRVIEATQGRSDDASRFALQMAQVGVVFKNSAGEVATSVKDLTKITSDIGVGINAPDQNTFAKAQAEQLRSGREVSAIQRGVQESVNIPGQLGQQLYTNPFTAAATGLGGGGAKGTVATSKYVSQGDIDRIQGLQDDLMRQADDGIRAQKAFIDTNLGSVEGTQFESLMKGVQGFGVEIKGLNETLANRQAGLGAMSYANNLRLINRSIGEAKAMAGVGGGSILGGLQRQLYDIGRQSQSLGLQSQGLSLGMNQRQINFQTAIAGFQAPGITGQERAARMAEAEAEAAYSQKQQNIGVQQYGLSKQGFGIEGKVFEMQADNALFDLERQKGILVESYAVQQEEIRVQKLIAALTASQAQLQAKALGLFNNATDNFNNRLSAAAGQVANFGGTVGSVTNALIEYITGAPRRLPGDTNSEAAGTNRAAGYDGGVLGATSFTAGEAGGEHVLVLRNPRHGTMGPSASGGGGGAQINITITGNSITSDTNLDELASKVAREVEDRLGQKASMLGVRAA